METMITVIVLTIDNKFVMIVFGAGCPIEHARML